MKKVYDFISWSLITINMIPCLIMFWAVFGHNYDNCDIFVTLLSVGYWILGTSLLIWFFGRPFFVIPIFSCIIVFLNFHTGFDTLFKATNTREIIKFVIEQDKENPYADNIRYNPAWDNSNIFTSPSDSPSEILDKYKRQRASNLYPSKEVFDPAWENFVNWFTDHDFPKDGYPPKFKYEWSSKSPETQTEFLKRIYEKMDEEKKNK